MSEPTEAPRATGHCLCKAVVYEVHGELRPVIDCHCWRCRRFSGHHVAASAATTGAVRFISDDSLRWYELDDGAAYGFCRRCGSSLFWKTSARPGRMSICAGSLDPPTGLETVEVIWASTASDYHELDPAVTTWPEERD